MSSIFETNKAAVEIIVATIKKNFAGTEDFTGTQIDDIALLQDLLSLNLNDDNPTKPFGLTTNITRHLIETGIFETRAYSKEGQTIWSPLQESFYFFRKRFPKHHAYVSGHSTPGFNDLKLWVDGFFK